MCKSFRNLEDCSEADDCRNAWLTRLRQAQSFAPRTFSGNAWAIIENGLPCRAMWSRREPVVFRWKGGKASIGYLGGLRWRVRTSRDCIDAPGVLEAVTLVFAAIFQGVPTGTEAAARSPLDVKIRGHVSRRFLIEPKFKNGWRCSSRLLDETVGDHATLLPFVAQRIANAADDVWAAGIRPVPARPLATRFSFKAFVKAARPEQLCRELESALQERLQEHPAPGVAFVQAMKELKASGHDLWSWTPEEVWGRDYMKLRRGAGLMVSRYPDDDEEGVANTVTVEFAPPGHDVEQAT